MVESGNFRSMRQNKKLLKESRKKGISEERRIEKVRLYKASNRKLKYMIRKQKRVTWRSFCESIENSDQMSRFRKILSKSSAVPSYLMKSDGTWTESSEEVLSSLFDTHFPGNKCESEAM